MLVPCPTCPLCLATRVRIMLRRSPVASTPRPNTVDREELTESLLSWRRSWASWTRSRSPVRSRRQMRRQPQGTCRGDDGFDQLTLRRAFHCEVMTLTSLAALLDRRRMSMGRRRSSRRVGR